MRETWNGLMAGVVAVVLFLAMLFGGFELYWHFRTESTNREDQTDRQSVGYQEAQRAELSQRISAINGIDVQINDPSVQPEQRQALAAQRHSIAAQACAGAARITTTNGMTADQSAWIGANCAAGAVAPGSRYAATT